ncbi:5-deoxy-glucuronate isomerase [Chloroflexota bacterium]
MSLYSLKVEPKPGYTAIPGNICGFKFIEEFGILRLEMGEVYQHSSGDDELGIMVLSGECSIEINGELINIGNRKDVFSGLPEAIYIPPSHLFKITGSSLEAAFCRTKAEKIGGHRIIRGSDVVVNHVGLGNWAREVRLVIPPKGFSQNLIMGETISPPGNWSGTPPHKHEVDNLPEESLHEELYYFKPDKPQGWGIQRTYSPSRDVNEFVYVDNNTITFMPWGYHQVIAGPGYALYYLFFLAGEGNELCGYEDPQHRWIK